MDSDLRTDKRIQDFSDKAICLAKVTHFCSLRGLDPPTCVVEPDSKLSNFAYG